MRDAALEALEMCRGIERQDFEKNRQLELALVKLVEIIGEAAYNVSKSRQAQLPMDFKAIVGMRHRLVHGYFNVDFDILWGTVQSDLPLLVKQIAFLENDGGGDGSGGSMSGGPS